MATIVGAKTPVFDEEGVTVPSPYAGVVMRDEIPTFWEVAGAAFRTENTLGSTMAAKPLCRLPRS